MLTKMDDFCNCKKQMECLHITLFVAVDDALMGMTDVIKVMTTLSNTQNKLLFIMLLRV